MGTVPRADGSSARSRVVADSPAPEPELARLAELPRLRVTATPPHASIALVVGTPSGAEEPARLEPIDGEASVYVLPGPGEWTLVAVDFVGASSAEVVLHAEVAGSYAVRFDFQRPVVIRGTVFDGVFGPRLPGAEVARVEARLVA